MSTYLPTVFGENLMDVFDDFDRNFFRGFGNIDRALYGKHAQNMMKTDVKETDEGYEVDVELPGFKKDEIQLELNNGYLTIYRRKDAGEGQREQEGQDAPSGALRGRDAAQLLCGRAYHGAGRQGLLTTSGVLHLDDPEDGCAEGSREADHPY